MFCVAKNVQKLMCSLLHVKSTRILTSIQYFLGRFMLSTDPFRQPRYLKPFIVYSTQYYLPAVETQHNIEHNMYIVKRWMSSSKTKYAIKGYVLSPLVVSGRTKRVILAPSP